MGALTSGQADLAIGVGPDSSTLGGVHSKPLGSVQFIYVVAPHHPLAKAVEPLSDELIQKHRAVAVADSVQRGGGLTFGLFSGQEVFTVASMKDKLEAQLRGLGGGNLPSGMASRYVEAGRLVVKQTERAKRLITVHYAWRGGQSKTQGRAMQWWLSQLESATTRTALLENHTSY
jgi:DNA-binding transcriptional LysR family regulator